LGKEKMCGLRIKVQKIPISSKIFDFLNLAPILGRCHSNSGLKQVVERGKGVES
jgi:hypothetical protein